MIKDEWWEEFDSYELSNLRSDKFNEWWDADKFDWKHSRHLATHCSDHFDEWWDAAKFNWENDSVDLAQHCSSKFTDLQLKQLCFHTNKYTRTFAIEELARR